MKPEEHQVKRESQSSFEFGSTKCKHKVYYWEVDELKAKMEALKTTFEENKWMNAMVQVANATK